MNQLKSFLSSKKFMMIASFVGLYLLSTGISLVAFSSLSGGVELLTGEIDDARSKISADLPKTEECPLNGGYFTSIEKDIWEGRRPIAAMIENHADARPQSGLSKADIVYEAVAEGGITRFLAIFYCGAAAEDVKIAPVRSARVYFVDWAAGYNQPIFMHVGGANNYSGSGDTVREAQALELLERLGWRLPRGNDFDTTYDSGFPVFWRNYERLGRPVATEHTMMASLDAAYDQAEKRGFDAKGWLKEFKAWLFMNDSPAGSPEATNVSFDFWENNSDYAVKWLYDSTSNAYLRENDGAKFTDHETGEQLSAKNVVVMFVKERGPVDRNKHMIYTTIGQGEALIFQNGKVTEGTWTKLDREDGIVFEDEKGGEVKFVRGPIWIEAVPAGNEVSY